MTIQPGNGYNFASSSQGTSLDIDKEWTPPKGGGFILGVPGVPELPEVPRIPEQLVNAPLAVIRPAPFQCRIVSVNGQRFLQIATGSIAYSGTNMPLIYDGAFTQLGQAAATKVQICPSGMRQSTNIYPGGDPGIDPSYSLDWWMEDGGGYQLSDINDPIVLYGFKWDVQTGVTPFDSSSVVNTGLPTLAIIASSNTADEAKIEKGTGPSIYENTMNVQKMEGYTAAEVDLPGDWGNCHTTWFNPRRFGYNYKAIAQVQASSSTAFSGSASIARPAVALLQNMIQKITFDGNPSGGSVTISCGGFTSTVSFPVTNFYSATVPVYSNELTLKACLESIVAFLIPGIDTPFTMLGNVEVSKYSDKVYYVSFVNQLQGLAVPTLTINAGSVTSYTWDFNIIQHHTGTLDLTIPMQFGMTQLMNKPDVTEAVDPYNLNKNGSPAWNDINNRADVIACTGFSGDVTNAGMQNLNAMTSVKPDYTKVGGCIEEPPFLHPFLVTYVSGAGGSSTYHIQSGTVNNVIPGNIATDITTANALKDVWLKVPYAAGVFPDTAGFEWAIGTTMPADTNAEGYVKVATVNGATVTQLVTGSLWADRIKLGSATATYYYARI
jgi:hypothetical protein